MACSGQIDIAARTIWLAEKLGLAYDVRWPDEARLAPRQAHGLGDDAFWTTDGSLFVQKGSRAFSISMPSLARTSVRQQWAC
jgi:hypothetical protein